MIHSELPYAPSTRFLPGKTKEIMMRLLREKIGDVVYDMEQAPLWAREISDGVKNEIRGKVDESLNGYFFQLVHFL